MNYIRNHITPALTYYYEALLEAFGDINTFLDETIESENGHNFIIALIIATPIAGCFVFYTVLMIGY